ncbi:unnamed protein product [Schistosoma mattheei]|uniref:Uncharacterized protein n=1 Tax=Schistosoma mattheei TaxID=31246 RepID=A0A3P8FWU9_9TREM|nr:unnamed protein product [Schistosoma mattheei]
MYQTNSFIISWWWIVFINWYLSVNIIISGSICSSSSINA